MTSAMYLEHYLDSLEGLPKELQKNFSQMRSLDTRSQQLSCQIDSSVDDYLGKVKGLAEDRRKKCLLGIQGLFDRNKKFADQKVQLAMQTYELVDRHIRRLDADLARFEAEMKERPLSCINNNNNNSLNANNNNEKNSSKSGGTGGSVKEGNRMKRRKKMRDDLDKKRRKKTSMLDGDSALSPSSSSNNPSSFHHPSLHLPILLSPSDPSSDVLEMPVDPNEPTYCTCHQVSYGEMIGCDNPDCPIEWFHFGCVSLSTKPKGKWFCGRCLSERRKKA